jgi:hypothetical protein
MRIRRPVSVSSSRIGKMKRVDPNPDPSKIRIAAESAVYAASDYHCPAARGQPPKRRVRYASICPKRWSAHAATNALRQALSKGQVSEAWEDGFPRYVWTKDGEVIYEARHTRGPTGTFHAYPIEKYQIPDGLKT